MKTHLKFLVVMLACLLGAAGVTFAQQGGMTETVVTLDNGVVGTLALPDAPVLEAVDLVFADRADGAVVVSGGGTETVLDPGTNGFVRGVLRGLARDRRARGIGADEPFRLMRRADGRLALEDPATGRVLDLSAFGPTNTEAFARLMPR